MKTELSTKLEQAKADHGGFTIKNYKTVNYKRGYQYSKTLNSETNTAKTVQEAIEKINGLSGTCGVWYNDGLYYIETSYHTNSKKKALEEGKQYEQISVYDWYNDSYITL